MSAVPFTAFNFAVEIVPEGGSSPLVSAAFAECDGLEMGMEVKTIREGGNNDRQIRLAGPATFGQLTLKRGMTEASFELWQWMSDSVADPSLRAEAELVLFAADGNTERARVVLQRCLPVKLKVPALHAKDGAVAVEELQLAYERFTVKRGR
ncbi:phage tail protein [Aquabacterium sp. A7-Y]|uniref:phage tail protein n=1 Tax=Aquabacterium sp. A7-Y TaxID=1349605 RepID=UPI00223DD799|nr:phage tail protein [Aquabacterium sp. A7-Y]MCW7541367.1 phage tail protein [Aquabacterium sp. A7-Y]